MLAGNEIEVTFTRHFDLTQGPYTSSRNTPPAVSFQGCKMMANHSRNSATVGVALDRMQDTASTTIQALCNSSMARLASTLGALR
jgi:hypothetical protein